MKLSGVSAYLILALQAIFFLNFTEAVLSDGAIEQTKKLIKNACKSKTKVTENELAATRTGSFPSSRPLQCYMSCALGMMKVMRKSEIDVDGAKKQLNALMPPHFKTPMTEQLEKCKDVGGVDACEVAANFVKCAYEVNPQSAVIPT